MTASLAVGQRRRGVGDGNDTFTWNWGDGSDTVDGQGGSDTLVFNGANISENISISANGNQGDACFRDVANITTASPVSRPSSSRPWGAPTMSLSRTYGSGVKQVAIDLDPRAPATDSPMATVMHAGNDQIDVTASGTAVAVTGLPAQVVVDHGEAADLRHDQRRRGQRHHRRVQDPDRDDGLDAQWRRRQRHYRRRRRQ